jgi:hypothetical protein
MRLTIILLFDHVCKDIWDNDKKCPADDLDWEDLSNEQRKAAGVLGYDEDSWNGDGGMAACCVVL